MLVYEEADGLNGCPSATCACTQELCSDRGRMSTGQSAKVVLFETMSLLIPNHHAFTVALSDPMADDADRTLELQWAERKHQLLRQRRLREASEDHGTTKRDDVLVLPPAGTRFDAPVRVAFM